MAKAIAHCKCKKCGETFTKENVLQNRSDANRWAEWAEANITLCLKCWGEAQREQEEERYKALKDELRLPEITGKSEKQIAFANDLRVRYVAQHAEELREMRRKIDGVSAEAVAKVMAAEGVDEDGAMRKAFAWMPSLYTQYIALTSSSAQELIDQLHRG
nr:MAG TPA: C2H2 type zinc-finger protein [Caudoviricetes sp.]